jgi:phage terminase small subunit
MPMKPKLSPEQWSEVRAVWEADPRDGYAWLVEELGLPVSAQAIGKVSRRDKWTKVSHKRQRSKCKNVGSPEVGIFIEVVGANVRAIDKLPEKQACFVREYTTDFNGTQAAIRAGYSTRTAQEQASRLLSNIIVQAALRELMADRVKRLEIDGDEIIRRWHTILNADPNELSQFRRLCCRHCWGDGFGYQYTPGEFQKAKLRHAEKRAETLFKSDQKVDIGEFSKEPGNWFDKRRDPNPVCPECHGDGVGEPFFLDTRKLSPAALALYSGVKEGREGIEILMASREKAAENLARALGLYKDKEAEVNINLVAGDDLHRMYAERMDIARARQAQVLAERGIKPEE